MARKPAKNESKSIVTPQSAALERFRLLLPPESFALLLAELDKSLQPAFRLNPLKASPELVEKWAARYGWELRSVPYCDAGWWVSSAIIPLSQPIEHRLGQYYIQDAASMLPAELFDWSGLPDPMVLDLAASPGGKTTHLLSKTGDRGLVIANDSSADRITALRLVLRNWGGLHVAVTRFHGEVFGDWFPNIFDRVLIDAPCSMQGLRSSESHPMRSITARERTSLAQRQLRLLSSALRAVRPGGQVVYSTCTLEPEEDEGVLDRLMRANPGLARIDRLDPSLAVQAPALSHAFEQDYVPEMENAIRLWPQLFGTAGFFAARLTKLAPSRGNPLAYPARPIERAGWLPLERKKLAWLNGVYQQLYGNDLSDLQEEHAIEFWQREAGFYAFPHEFFRRFSDLPVQGLGLLLGEESPEGFIPSHEWVARFGDLFQTGRCILEEGQVDAWLRGEDVPGARAKDLANGQVVAVFDTSKRLLGRGKVLNDRLKNLLPKRLF